MSIMGTSEGNRSAKEVLAKRNEIYKPNKQEILFDTLIQCVPMISDSLRRTNAIECIKALYEIGKIDKEHYAKYLSEIIKLEGFKI